MKKAGSESAACELVGRALFIWFREAACATASSSACTRCFWFLPAGVVSQPMHANSRLGRGRSLYVRWAILFCSLFFSLASSASKLVDLDAAGR